MGVAGKSEKPNLFEWGVGTSLVVGGRHWGAIIGDVNIIGDVVSE
jgi:hypothetical protein